MTFGHGHHHEVDRSAVTSDAGIRAVKVSTAGLALTAAIQFAVVGVGGSAALLSDALHNFGDVFTTVGLWIAFQASRRAADRRYTFGYDRFEDLIGVVIVLIIAATAALAGYESFGALGEDKELRALPASIVAALVGVVGNELVAQYKIRVGRKVNSVALEADGLHSRTDGIVSAGAVVGLVGVAVGYPMADPIAGLAITLVIVWVVISAAGDVMWRIVDRVDPALIDKIENCAKGVSGVVDVHEARARWAGRSLYVELHIALDESLPLHDAHSIGEEVRHRVLHDVEGVSQVLVHLDPWAEGKPQGVYHAETDHHFQ